MSIQYVHCCIGTFKQRIWILLPARTIAIMMMMTMKMMMMMMIGVRVMFQLKLKQIFKNSTFCYHASNPIIWLISPSSVHFTQTTGNSIAPLTFVCVKYKQMDQKRIFPTGSQRLVQSAGETQWHLNLLVYGEIYCIKPPLNILCQSIFRPCKLKVVLQLYRITKQH